MQHLDEGAIHAWLDGALSIEEAARAEAHVASCSVCADAVAEARGLIAASTRILTALDQVPNVRAAGGAGGAAKRRFLSTWLVRERIAAVMALVVAGGALAVVLSRETPQIAQLDRASEPLRTLELAAADSPALPPVAAEEAKSETAPVPRASARAVPTSPTGARDLAAAREVPSVPQGAVGAAAPATVTTDAYAMRTDDSLRSVTVATAQRAEARDLSAEGKSPVAGKVAAMARQRTVEPQARYVEPRPSAPAVGAAAGAAAPSQGPRLLQEEKMMEGGREVRRRIYMVEGILVTLDERAPVAANEAERAASANVARADTAAASPTIRWTDASGTEFTLTGPGTRERLERIKKLLGY
jgi:hypothetical protein